MNTNTQRNSQRRQGICSGLALAIGIMVATSACADTAREAENWQPLFDGETLDGWTPKFRGAAYGENFADTFRVEDGAIVASYENYDSFDSRFGHLYYAVPYSRYRLRFEYRLYGESAKDIPEWARRNSGVMFHTPCPETNTTDQDFPISLEFQVLRGLDSGEPRPTGNLCTPGTMVVFDGKDDERHCIQSSSPTYNSDDWVSAEILVLGDEKIVHTIDRQAVLEYEKPTYGGPPAVNSDPDLLQKGEAISGGYIALQAEGHPVAFRNIELLNLGGPPEDERFNCPR